MSENDQKLNNEQISSQSAEVMSTPSDDTDIGDPTAIKEAIRWREQCILARGLPDIIEQYTSLKPKPWHYVTSFSSQADASTGDFINRLHMSEGSGGKDGFVNISTFERANMLWALEIYKVLYKDQDPDVAIKKYEFDAEVPLIFEEMAAGDMSDFKSGKTNNYHTKQGGTMNGGKSGKYVGRPQTGYGIKSFEWRYIGANPETVRNDIEATLILEFQNFDQLSKIRTIDILKDGKTKTEPVNYSLLDLLGYGPNSPRNEGGKKADEYDPAFFEIKAIAYWNANKDIKKKDSDIDLKTKIKGQKTTLFLTLIDHDFSISQIGTFTLVMTYRARLEAHSAQMHSNVLFRVEDPASPGAAGLLKEKEIEIADLLKTSCNQTQIADLKAESAILLKKAWIAGAASLFGAEMKSNYMENNITSELQKTSRAAQDKHLNKIYPGMFEERYMDPRSADSWRMRTFDVPRENVKKYLNGGLGSAERIGIVNSGLGQVGPGDSVFGEPLPADVDEPENFPMLDQGTVLNRSANWSGTAETYSINFFLLGDLLDILAHRAFSKQYFLKTDIVDGSFGSAEMIKIISGPVRFRMRNGHFSGQGTFEDYNEIICSLSDIPISMETFTDFWYRNVVQTGRTTYPLMDIIRDLGDQVINRSFGEGCAEGVGRAIGGKTRLKTGFVSLPQAADGTDPLLNLDRGAYESKTGDVLVENTKDILKPDVLASTSADKVFNYIVLFLDNQESHLANLDGIEENDAKKGIYHLKIHEGILQSINFNKTDQPYLRESRYFIYNEDPLVHLSNVYNVRASMVGNTCFYPGDMVYIDPVGFGTSLGDPMTKRSLSNVMGLGGYHTIISVTNKMSRDFTTEIDALWTSNAGNRPRIEESGKCVDVDDKK